MDPVLSYIESDKYTDYKGRMVDPRKHGGLRAATLACVVEIMTSTVTLCNGVTLVDYFLKSMHYSVSDSSIMVTNFLGTSYLVSIFWGFISDAYITRFTTFVLSGVLELMGLLMLTYQSQNKNLQPPENQTPSYTQAVFLYIGLYGTAIGVGGIKATLAAHGADQLDQTNKPLISSYFSWYFFSICIGALSATGGMVLIKENYGWSTSFQIMVLLTSLALCTFVSGFSLYKYKRPSGSALSRVIQVLVSSVRNRKVSNAGNLDHEVTAGLLATDQAHEKLKFLNRALMDNKVTIAQIKETKSFLGLLPIFATAILMNCCLAQVLTFSVQQGSLMNRTVYNFTIPTQVLAVGPISISIISIIIFEQFKKGMNKNNNNSSKFYQPLVRMGMGLALVTTSMFIASIIESKRVEEFKNGNTISVFWLAAQYILLGLSDTLTMGGMMEFFYTEAPESMRSICTSLTWCSSAMGLFMSSLLVTLSNSVSGRFGMEWFGGKDLNHSRLDLFYALLCFLNFFNLWLYIYFAKKY